MAHTISMPARAVQTQEAVGRLSDFEACRLSQDALRDLFATQVAERYEPPRALCWEGENAGHIFYLLEGCVRIFRSTAEGRRAILDLGYAGDLVGLSARHTYPFTAEAVVPTRFKRLSRSRFNCMLEQSADLRAHFYAEVCSEMNAAQDQIIRLGRTSADERVVTFLLNLAQRTRIFMTAPVEVDVPFGRLDIADYLGLTVETVSREISKLRHDGLISTNGPHRIVLERLSRLREIAKMDELDLGHQPGREAVANCHTGSIAPPQRQVGVALRRAPELIPG